MAATLFFTAAVRRHFAALRESCRRHGIPFTVLGWGQTWRGFNWKFNLFRDWLRGRPADALVLFVDAYDVLVLRDAAAIHRCYDELTGGTGDRVLFGRENPTGDVLMDLVGRLAFPVCESSIINTGVYVGPAGRILDVLAHVDGHDDARDDQKLMNTACRENHEFFRERVTLDAEGRFVFTAICQRKLGYVTGQCGQHMTLDPTTLRAPTTNEMPCVLHAPAALDMDPYCRTLGLPLGKHRPRIRWIMSNWWPHFVGGTLVLICIAAALTVRIVRSVRR